MSTCLSGILSFEFREVFLHTVILSIPIVTAN